MINHFIYIITFSILFQLLSEVKPQTTTFEPGLRLGHTATLINDNLYILGGVISPYSKSPKAPKETFFYLDVSVPFNTENLSWVDLSDNNSIPLHYFASAIKGGADNTLFIYGGEVLNNGTMDLVYTFDAQNYVWRTPNITGISSTGKVSITPVIDDNELIYLFGGLKSEINTTYTNDMFILDSINLSWKKASSINAPSPRLQYGAVFLPNKNIIYMGGFNLEFGRFPLDKVYLYDTMNDIWTTKTTTGSIPSARSSFSSVLGLDGQRVILFGGSTDNNSSLNRTDSLYVLDLNNFNWHIPKVSGIIPNSRAFHMAVLIKKYMVVTFGNGYTQGVEDDVLLLDISNNDEYMWKASFELDSVSSTTITSPTQSNANNTNTLSRKTTIVIITVVPIVCSIVLITVCFFLFKQTKKHHSPADLSRPSPQHHEDVNSFYIDDRF